MRRTLFRLNAQKGVTGLETAIILIAFVMVASVLAYVVLSAGLFSSQKVKDAVHSGLEEASTIEVRGSVLASMSDNIVTELYFSVGTISGAAPVDFTDTSAGANKVVISYSDAYQQVPSLDWTMERLNSINDNNLLEPNELFQITVSLAKVNDEAEAGETLTAYRTFTVEVKPPSGAVLTIERTIPPKNTKLINLY
ncbi:MAG: hypothetical protein HYX96_02455 [Chloroflexi bacterium]|nr:hypothetical protein [Chloroflexota bacterium]